MTVSRISSFSTSHLAPHSNTRYMFCHLSPYPHLFSPPLPPFRQATLYFYAFIHAAFCLETIKAFSHCLVQEAFSQLPSLGRWLVFFTEIICLEELVSPLVGHQFFGLV